jgi:hypothetical protein
MSQQVCNGFSEHRNPTEIMRHLGLADEGIGHRRLQKQSEKGKDSHLITSHIVRPPRTAAISSPWRRAIVFILAMSVIALAVSSTSGARSASAADSTVTQCDGVDNQGGRTVRCTVEVAMTGATTATVTVTSCTGAGTSLTCIGPTVSTQSVTAIDQCNGSGNGGGATVWCDVIVTGAQSGTGAVTVSQCIGSGQGGGTQPTTVCVPSSTPSDTSATIQQCDSSGNGGGGTERVKCDVTPASTTASVPTIKQCNGSGNGGGALVTCTVTINGGGAAAGTPAAEGTATAAAGETETAIAAAGSVSLTAGGTRTATAPSTTPASGQIVAPNTGGGPGGGNGNEAWLLVLALGTLGVSAIGGSIASSQRRARPARMAEQTDRRHRH